MHFLAVTGRVRSDLSSFLPQAARAFEIFTNLLAPGGWMRRDTPVCIPDLWGTAPSCRNFITKLAEAVRQLGLIDGRGKLLGGEEALRLNRARLAIVALGDIENNRVCVQLWRDVAIDGAGGIMLELSGDKSARSLRWMIAADASLRVVFELFEGNTYALPMCFAYTLIAADKCGQRDRFRRGKGRIPPGSVLHRLDGLAVGILIFIGRSLAHKLLARLWMLALAEFREVLSGDHPGQTELSGQSPLPFARDDAALRPIVLLLRGELLLVVGLCLASGERFGNGQHGGY